MPRRRRALLLLAGLLCACSGGGTPADGAGQPAGNAGTPPPAGGEVPTGGEDPAGQPSTWPPERVEEAVSGVAAEVVDALARRDVSRLAAHVHPGRGVRFSPYAYVAPGEHVVLSASELVAAWSDPAPRTWGYEDATGEAIELTLPEYLDRYVHDGDFAGAGEVGYNTRRGAGNTLDNAADVYPEGAVVEYHLAGTHPDYGGMDWRSLRLVFARDESRAWRLVAIIHDEWTI